MLPSFMKHLLRVAKDSELTVAKAGTQIHVCPRSNIALPKKFIWVSGSISWKKQNELFGKPNTMIVPWLFAVFPALETTGDSNNHHIKHNFTLL